MSQNGTPTSDHRLYFPAPETWTAHVKSNSTKEYCYTKMPGEEHFHLLVKGEIYLQHQDEKLCLNCAMRQGVLTANRMHWQRT